MLGHNNPLAFVTALPPSKGAGEGGAPPSRPACSEAKFKSHTTNNTIFFHFIIQQHTSQQPLTLIDL